MAEKVLNILLISLLAIFSIAYGVKTVLIDVAKKQKDEQYEEDKNKAEKALVSVPYTLSIDSRFDK